MNPLSEDQVLVQLLTRGLVSIQDLRDMEEELSQARTLVMAGAAQQRRITWLLQKGKITRDDLEAVKVPAREPEAKAAPPVRDRSTADRLARARYKVLQLIGEGGMGKVYKAHDRKLDRYVALKFLLATDPEMVRRFQREAQSQARIEHPGICRVYEVGELDGRPYIAMQFIDGGTLKSARTEMTLEQKLQVVRTAAEAMHEAHRIGLIHRDLNPSNIMVERSETGTWIPYLMDFGLAKELAGPGLTQDGTAAGTPYYMSPEQAAGDIQKLDRRTDIYALGATLYELLSGAPPFEGASVFDILEKVVHAEAIPLRRRNPDLPEDLESIVMKCLEKEPQRRYESARALAEDLGRYLDGEPVNARPASLLYRFRKKAGKNKLAFGIGGTALLALLAVSSLWLGERWAARERAALAQRFGAEVQELESVLRYAHMLPLHDITPEKRQVESRMASIRARMDRMGGIARGPGMYALGRGHLALDRPEEALESLKTAWDGGYRDPAVAAALGRAYSRVYQDRLPEAESIRNPELRQAKVRELEERLRRPALEFLREGAGVSTDAPEYTQAVLALLDRRWSDAQRLAARALARVPWLYEAYRLEGEACAGQARASEGEGKFQEAGAMQGRAQDAYARALRIAPSDPTLYTALVDLHSARMRQEQAQGLPVEGTYAEAVAAAREALQVDAARPDVHEALSLAEWMLGVSLRGAGRDPLSALGRAEAAARRALALDPRRPTALYRLGLSFITRGEWEWDTGRDPVASFQEALRCYERALAIEPGNIVALNNLGNAHNLLGEYGRGRGEDPVPHLRRSIDAYTLALEIQPRVSYLHNNLGNSWASIGEHRMDRGEDPSEALAEAERNHREAVRINPKYGSGWRSLAFDLSDRSRWAAKSGGDPEPLLRQSLEAYSTAQDINPAVSSVHLNAANVHLDWAEWLLDHGRDPLGHLEQADASLKQSLAIRAADAYAQASLGVARHIAALWSYARGGDPIPDLREAERCFTEAQKVDPTYATVPRERGIVRFDLALLGTARSGERMRLLSAAETDLRQALVLNPKDALAHSGLSRILLARGGDPAEALAAAERGRGLDPLDSETALRFGEALAAGGKRSEAETILLEALGRRTGSVKLLLALAELHAGSGGGSAGEEGREALMKVLKAFPRHPRAIALSAAQAGGR